MADHPAAKLPLIERLWAVLFSTTASDSERLERCTRSIDT